MTFLNNITLKKISIVLICLMLMLTVNTFAYKDGDFFVDIKPTGAIVTVGEEFNVYIMVNAPFDVVSFSFAFTYDPKIIKATNVEPSVDYADKILGSIYEEPGLIKVEVSNSLENFSIEDPTFMTVTFLAIKEGESGMGFGSKSTSIQFTYYDEPNGQSIKYPQNTLTSEKIVVKPEATPTPDPTVTPSPTPTSTPYGGSSYVDEDYGSFPTPTPKATATPTPTATPTVTPSPTPTVTPVPTTQPPAVNFTDITDFVWAEKSIYELNKAGIISGKSATEYDPVSNITRAEFSKLAVAVFGLTGTSNAASFSDIPDGAWYKEFVDIASSNGLVNGLGDGIFGANEPITREDLCTILIRGARTMNLALPDGELDFKDISDFADYSKESIGILSQLGIVNGKGEGAFAPKDNANRAEAAKIIYGIFEMIDRQ